MQQAETMAPHLVREGLVGRAGMGMVAEEGAMVAAAGLVRVEVAEMAAAMACQAGTVGAVALVGGATGGAGSGAGWATGLEGAGEAGEEAGLATAEEVLTGALMVAWVAGAKAGLEVPKAAVESDWSSLSNRPQGYKSQKQSRGRRLHKCRWWNWCTGRCNDSCSPCRATRNGNCIRGLGRGTCRDHCMSWQGCNTRSRTRRRKRTSRRNSPETHRTRPGKKLCTRAVLLTGI